MKKVGILINTNDPETCWVAVHYATFHLDGHNDTNIFFVESGTKYREFCTDKHDFAYILENFIRAGGRVYDCENREHLKYSLIEQFTPELTMNDIADICNNNAFLSIMTSDIYIKEFKRIVHHDTGINSAKM